jgi:hypothetical protein
VDLLLPGAHPPGSVVTCRLTERPVGDAAEVAVTAMDPPLFGADGAALQESLSPAAERPAQAYEHIGEGNGR